MATKDKIFHAEKTVNKLLTNNHLLLQKIFLHKPKVTVTVSCIDQGSGLIHTSPEQRERERNENCCHRAFPRPQKATSKGRHAQVLKLPVGGPNGALARDSDAPKWHALGHCNPLGVAPHNPPDPLTCRLTNKCACVRCERRGVDTRHTSAQPIDGGLGWD